MATQVNNPLSFYSFQSLWDCQTTINSKEKLFETYVRMVHFLSYASCQVVAAIKSCQTMQTFINSAPKNVCVKMHLKWKSDCLVILICFNISTYFILSNQNCNWKETYVNKIATNKNESCWGITIFAGFWQKSCKRRWAIVQNVTMIFNTSDICWEDL